ncbi:B3 domain-containing protein REM10 isoform X3 [Capsicum annuum]|uniref:B3 domain-containing protein REM10 isoform X3 n=1 Tax=Capsicum annuum TaxID=4072 RepID=UPI001FB19478|nr:B3 domain-containing protein REM10 isoform X3 [Capsicum annuum]
MKIPPRKPHFFKPILPGFKNGINVPIGFLKYLKGHEHIEHALLKRGGKEWLVKVNGRRFEDGWKKFAKEHGLQLGDLLIFRHDGDMKFEVITIFDSTHCEREYAEYLRQEEGKDVEEEHEEEEDGEEEEDEEEEHEEEAHIVEEISKDFEFKGKPKPKIKTSGKAFSNVEAAKHMNLSHSHFICTIRPYCLSAHFLCIPKKFAQENRLHDRKCMMIMRDEQQTWTFSVYTNGNNTCIGSGWHEFCITKCLKEGDCLMFEIVSNGETPIFRFHDLRGSPSLQAEVKKKNLDAERMSDKDDRLKTSDVTTPKSQLTNSTGKPRLNIKTSGKALPNVEAGYMDMHLSYSHFICTIRPYSLSKYCLCIPKQFAQENGLNDRKCMIIVRDEQQSWTFGVYTSGKATFIGSGWHEFCITNCLKEGDHLLFEIVSNGETPIFRFHDLRGSPSLQPEVKKKKLDAERRPDKAITDVRLKTSDVTTPESQIAASTSADANPHFISTVQPYTLRFPVLYLPMAFAKSNGFLNKCELILVDEKQRLWSVCLGRIGNTHFGIKRGWPQFRLANGVQVGDTYKFELTNNDTVPIVHFHCKYTGN